MFGKLREYRIVPHASIESVDEGLGVAEALTKAGLPVLEFEYRTHLDNIAIKAIREKFPDFWVGAGNVLNKDLLLRVMDAGARFALAPGVNAETIQLAIEREFQFAPGVCTPSDIENALLNGATNFQFLPAEAMGGAPLLLALLDPFKHLPVEFIPKGGISRQKVSDYLAVPQVAAVNVDWITPKDLIKQKKWTDITTLAKKAIDEFA